MADGTTATKGLDSEEATAQDASQTPPAGASPAQDAAQDGAVSGITDPATLQRELAKTRAEAAEWRTKLRAFEEAQKKAAEAQLTEAERLERRVTELEKQNEALLAEKQELVILNAVTANANKLGIVDPEAAVKLLDRKGLKLADDGSPENLDAALRDLLKEKPYLTAKPSASAGRTDASAGVTAGPPPNLTADELSAAQAAGMTPERYAALKQVKTLDDYQRLPK